MAVVVYECDTCKREVYRKQNTQGIDIVGRCIITDGCKGKLLQKEIKPSHAVGHSTAPVIGLRDWTPRKILYTHTQALAKKQWIIQHNMNGMPIVNVFSYSADGSLKLNPIVPVEITFTSSNVVTISFATSVAGVAQLLMRSSVTDQTITTLKPRLVESDYNADMFVLSESVFMTNGPETYGELTIATRVVTRDKPDYGFDPYEVITIQPHYLSPSTGQEILPLVPPMTFRPVDQFPVDTASSPWAGVIKTVIGGAQYIVRSANIHSASGTLPSLGIAEGSPVYFTVTAKVWNPTTKTYAVGERVLKKGEMLGLLADSPFLTVDKIMDKYVDLSLISEATAPRQLVYTDYNWRVNPSLLTKTYPTIITL